MGNSHCPHSHCRSTCYTVENTKPHYTWERSYLLEFAVGHPAEVHELVHTPLKGNYSVSTGIPWTMDLLKCAIPGMEHTPLKKGSSWGSWSGISCPQAQLPTHWECCLPLEYAWYVQPGQVPKSSNLSLLKARWTLLFTSMIMWVWSSFTLLAWSVLHPT